MKTLKTLTIALLILVIAPVTAQSADEIINNFFENTGGADNWAKLEGVQMDAEVNAQGMVIPLTIIQTKDGKHLVKINIQGQEITQFAFDGETMWTTNMMTMTPEKSDQEASDNMKKQAKDFPHPLFNYKNKGYTVEKLEDATMEGTDTFKIKVTQDPIKMDGVETPNIIYYYFDKENFVPIATETKIQQGPMKGQMNKSTFSDYEEVDGLYFPFAMDMGGQPITFKKITINPKLDMKMFAFPETAKPAVEEKK